MRVGAVAGDDRRVVDDRVVEVGVHVERHGDRRVGIDRADAAQEFALAVLEALGHHRAVQVEHDAVETALSDGVADDAGDVLEGGILDRAARRRAGGDRQDHLRPFALGEIEIGAEPRAGAAIGPDRRLAIERPRAPVWPNRASGVGTGENVLVSCFIIAINRRIEATPVRQVRSSRQAGGSQGFPGRAPFRHLPARARTYRRLTAAIESTVAAQPHLAWPPASVIVMWPIVVSALAPCQWRSPALICATSPTLISRCSRSLATMPEPDTTISS